jgi:hypothetical protein
MAMTCWRQCRFDLDVEIQLNIRIRRRFALKRHFLRASLYRKLLGERFSAWYRFTELTQGPSAF